MAKTGQKTRFFLLFKTIKSLVLSGIVVKAKFLWSFINILQKLHTWEKSSSQVIIAKNGLRPMRFQYSLIINISLTDWYLTLISTVFRNILVWLNYPILVPKSTNPHNSGSIVKKKKKNFGTMKLVNKQTKIILMIFPKNVGLGQMDHFGPKMAHPHNSGLSPRIFLNFA